MEVGRSRGADGNLKVSDGYFVRSPCAFAAQLEPNVPNPGPFSPRGRSKGRGGRVGPSSASPLEAAF